MTLLKTTLLLLVLLATITSVAQEIFTSPDGFYRFNLPEAGKAHSPITSASPCIAIRDSIINSWRKAIKHGWRSRKIMPSRRSSNRWL